MDINEIVRKAVEEVMKQVQADNNCAATAEFAPASLAKYVDHTLLKPEATAAQVDRLCQEAKEYDFFSASAGSVRFGRTKSLPWLAHPDNERSKSGRRSRAINPHTITKRLARRFLSVTISEFLLSVILHKQFWQNTTQRFPFRRP